MTSNPPPAGYPPPADDPRGAPAPGGFPVGVPLGQPVDPGPFGQPFGQPFGRPVDPGPFGEPAGPGWFGPTGGAPARTRLPGIAWLLPVAALLAVLGAAIPWFRPRGSYAGRTETFSALYSWRDGRIGLLAPLLLLVLAVHATSVLAGGRPRGRFARSSDPVRATGNAALLAGLVSGVCLVIAWFLVRTQYHFTVAGQDYSWSRVEALGISLTPGPQPGFLLTVVAALLAVVAGVAIRAAARPAVLPATGPGWQDQGT